MNNYKKKIKDYLLTSCDRMYSPPVGAFKHKCLLPVAGYSHQLWDWGCWTSNIAVRQVMTDANRASELFEYEKGCRLNFLDFQTKDGKIPIVISDSGENIADTYSPDGNFHKPVMAQHCAFIIKYTDNTQWLEEVFDKIEKFLSYYEETSKHESGLFFFIDDFAIGVDTDPCTFFRPRKSSASIFLNTLMYKEYLATAYICERLGKFNKQAVYNKKAEDLKMAINKNCWDEKDGFYYSCDINLAPIDKNRRLHSGCPRYWDNLIQRIGVWSGFMPMWANMATKEQAERIVKENYLDSGSFYAPYGVRSLSKYEKMYSIIPSNNPSSWHGSVWGISNYMVWKGLLNYGYKDLADELADKTIELFGKDIEKNGAMHEYYDPETGEGIYNKDFLSWNMLVANMIAWKENREVISEF